MWLVYTLSMGGILVGLARVLWGQGTGQPYLYMGLAAGYLLVAGLFVFLVNRLAGRIRTNMVSRRVLALGEALTLVAFLSIGLVLRLGQLDNGLEGLGYFEAAKVVEGHQVPQVVHGASYLYLHLLHLLFRFLGNKAVLGVWLQILLQLVEAMLLYVAVRKLAGRLPGLVALGLLMCSDHWARGVRELSPEGLFFCLFFLGLILTTAWMGERTRMPGVFLAGAWTGLAGYLDISGFLLGVMAIAVLWARKEELSGEKDGSFREKEEASREKGRLSGEKEEASREKDGPFGEKEEVSTENSQRRWKKRAAAGAFYLAGSVLGFAGFLVADALLCGKTVRSVLGAWGTLYSPEGYALPATNGEPGVPPDILVMVGLMGLGIFSFWCDRKKERMGMWILAACLSVAASSFGVFTPEMPGYGMLYQLCCVLAGVSLGACFSRSPVRAALAQGGESQSGKRAGKLAENLDRETGVEEKQTGAMEEGNRTESKKTEENGMGSGTEEKRAGDTGPEGEDKPKVKFIENPLPLPKKHERRVMDYARQVSVGEEEYDLSVQDGDDFDLA